MTICAISTAPGTGGIAVARISGPQAIEITDKIWRGKSLSAAKSHTARLGTIFDPDTKEDLDSAVATVYRSPKSFTGEDVVELSVHGSTWIQRELINILIRNGARLAEPGEFSRRAFAAGKMDLAEAEAVADMIASSSRAAHHIAMSQMRGDYSRRLSKMRDDLLQLCALLELELDFSEEDVEFADRTTLITLAETIHETVTRMSASFATGNALKNGVPVAIIGATNAGKSTLLNRLLEDDKAIVSSIHGTTRDTIEDTAEINGILFRFIDTAGLRETTDPIESIGINLTSQHTAVDDRSFQSQTGRNRHTDQRTPQRRNNNHSRHQQSRPRPDPTAPTRLCIHINPHICKNRPRPVSFARCPHTRRQHRLYPHGYDCDQRTPLPIPAPCSPSDNICHLRP